MYIAHDRRLLAQAGESKCSFRVNARQRPLRNRADILNRSAYIDSPCFTRERIGPALLVFQAERERENAPRASGGTAECRSRGGISRSFSRTSELTTLRYADTDTSTRKEKLTESANRIYALCLGDFTTSANRRARISEETPLTANKFPPCEGHALARECGMFAEIAREKILTE